MSLRPYLVVTKPGIVFSNLLATLGGYFVAVGGGFNWRGLFGVLAGTSLVIAGSCVVNNYIDRSIDKKMARTRKRPSVTGVIGPNRLIPYGVVLIVIGFLVLGFATNLATVFTGVVGVYSYLFLYGYYKRRSWLGTLVGAIPGATPPVAGYVACSGMFDAVSLWLFIVLVTWQMPHFYAIAIFRMNEYKSAGLPVKPLVHGVARTVRAINVWILLFVAVNIALWSSAKFSFLYLAVMLPIGLFWFWVSCTKSDVSDSVRWARRVFKQSLITLLVMSGLWLLTPVI